MIGKHTIWGERERAPHIRVCCEFSIHIYVYIYLYVSRTSCNKSLAVPILCLQLAWATCTFYRTCWEHAHILNVLSTLVISVKIVPATLLNCDLGLQKHPKLFLKQRQALHRKERERASRAERHHNSSCTHTKLSTIWLSQNIYAHSACSRSSP